MDRKRRSKIAPIHRLINQRLPGALRVSENCIENLYYIGLDVHKRKIAYCIKDVTGKIIKEGFVLSQRKPINDWLKTFSTPWIGAMEATMFTGWIYDHLKPHAVELKVAHPEMLKAIIAGKKKNDRVDAAILADLLRTNLLPECYMLP